ncbi:baseplate protein W [Bacillus phage Thurquoise]|uniref:Baseplate assembly protein n=1 Tax=Bacillus phage Deep Blue TaxID=1792245 RepID=A0A140HLZ0_9CAUD|nr:baseplate protein [Bacillus phage Deep Blue]AMO26002.1 hypothetical protein Blue_179 [Bacillus phage Deep Blue]UXQ88953.1 baseplate protein W [Bacillus phage Thurquoise]
MAKFKRRIIADGDTMQAIAQQELGDVNRWVELARFNDLRHPYIVDTVAEKLQNPSHLVTIGDTILIEISENSQAELMNALNRATDFDKEELYALALGKDLDVIPIPKQFGKAGWDSDIFEMKDNERGDVATIRGIENLKQSLYMRLVTPLGGYLGYPRYGSKVHEYLGRKNTEENAVLLDIEIERTLRTDGRVRSVEKVGHIINGNSYSTTFKVYSIAMEEAFLLALSGELGVSGSLVLTDNFVDNIIR